MGERDATPSKMPGFPFPSQPGCELGEPLLDALLDGRSLPPDAPEQACVVAEMLAGLAGPAEPGELAGEAAARFGYARSVSPVGVSPAARRPARQRPWLSAPRGGLAAGLVAAAVGLGGAAAAYAGALPGPIQDFAHQVIGAPPHRADFAKPQPGKPGKSKADDGRAGGPKARVTPGAVAPGASKDRRRPLPTPAKGHAKPSTPPGKAAQPHLNRRSPSPSRTTPR